MLGYFPAFVCLSCISQYPDYQVQVKEKFQAGGGEQSKWRPIMATDHSLWWPPSLRALLTGQIIKVVSICGMATSNGIPSEKKFK